MSKTLIHHVCLKSLAGLDGMKSRNQKQIFRTSEILGCFSCCLIRLPSNLNRLFSAIALQRASPYACQRPYSCHGGPLALDNACIPAGIPWIAGTSSMPCGRSEVSPCAGHPYVRTSLPLRALPLLSLLLRLAMQKWQAPLLVG